MSKKDVEEKISAKEFKHEIIDIGEKTDKRHVKCKQKISGFFKSKKGLQNYLDIKSLIITCKKQCLDFYTIIRNIFQNIPVEI